jgi:hypothetical protein
MSNCPLECGVKIKKSFYFHFNTCRRKNLLGTEYLKCKFDNYHIIKREEYEEHLEKCTKKKLEESNSDSSSEDGECDLTNLAKIINKNKLKKLGFQEEDSDSNENNKILNEGTLNNRRKKSFNNIMMFNSLEEIDEDSKNFYSLFIIS